MSQPPAASSRRVSPSVRRKLLDDLIENISNPRNAERLRIIQLVEDQLDAIQEEVRTEVQARLDCRKIIPGANKKKTR
jgi:hypothetical protein